MNIYGGRQTNNSKELGKFLIISLSCRILFMRDYNFNAVALVFLFQKVTPGDINLVYNYKVINKIKTFRET